MAKRAYNLVANIERPSETLISGHYTLAQAGRAWQAAHTGNMRRVITAFGTDVTERAVNAANNSKQ
jgi:hypothetical protein